MSFGYGAEFLCREPNGFVPGRRDQPAAFLITNQRRANSLFMVHKRMTETALDTKKLAIQSAYVAVARDNTHQFAAPRPERHLAAIRTVRARRNCLRELPGSRLMAISTIEQCSRRTNLDTVAALGTIQPTTISSNDGVGAAIAGLDGFFTHPFIADPGAALAQNASLWIIGDHR